MKWGIRVYDRGWAICGLASAKEYEALFNEELGRSEWDDLNAAYRALPQWGQPPAYRIEELP